MTTSEQENVVMFTGKTEDGTKVKIYKDKFHFRAFSAAGKQIGDPFISMVDLLNKNGITLDPPKTETQGGSRPGQEGVGEVRE